MLSEVARRALQTAWYQKWSIHRRLRPEEFGARLHIHFDPAHEGGRYRGRYERDWDDAYAQQLFREPVLDGKSLLQLTREASGSYLLPQACPEGCPLHSAYCAGHATAAAACATLLKAFVDDDRPLDDLWFRNRKIFRPVEPDKTGRRLQTVSLPNPRLMTIGGELNKLASNESLFRDFAGVHWRSDHTYSLLLGQAVGIAFLWDVINTYSERFTFSLRTFEGYRISIRKGGDLLESLAVDEVPPAGYPDLQGLYNPVWAT